MEPVPVIMHAERKTYNKLINLISRRLASARFSFALVLSVLRLTNESQKRFHRQVQGKRRFFARFGECVLTLPIAFSIIEYVRPPVCVPCVWLCARMIKRPIVGFVKVLCRESFVCERMTLL